MSWALGGHLAHLRYYRHIVLVELDRATTQDFDILMEAVTTRFEILKLNSIISSTSCDTHQPALDLVASCGGSNTEPQPVVPDASL